jgi:hypothetical protein
MRAGSLAIPTRYECKGRESRVTFPYPVLDDQSEESSEGHLELQRLGLHGLELRVVWLGKPIVAVGMLSSMAAESHLFVSYYRIYFAYEP